MFASLSEEMNGRRKPQNMNTIFSVILNKISEKIENRVIARHTDMKLQQKTTYAIEPSTYVQ